MIATITPFIKTKKAFGDLPGKFPITSSRGAQYFLVIYHYDSNAILVRTLKNRTAQEIKTAYLHIYNLLKARGVAPKTFILDNETSNSLLNAFEKEKLTYQLVPPHIHRKNAAERAIDTWKNHFIAGLSSVHPEFPLHEWDRLTDQGMITLNLLRNARVNPKLSAYEYIFGHFNYTATPIAPPGMKLVVHMKPAQRGSWDPHGTIGFYVGPTLIHYRCFKCFIPTTNSKRITDTITFLPHNKNPVPTTSTAENILQELRQLIKIAKTSTKPFDFIDDSEDSIKSINEIEKIFTKKSPKKSSKMSQQKMAETYFRDNIPNKYNLPLPTNLPIHPSPTIKPTIPSPRVRVHNKTKMLCKTNQHQNVTQSKGYTTYPLLNHIYDDQGRRQTLDSLRQSNKKEVWERALSNEWG